MTNPKFDGAFDRTFEIGDRKVGDGNPVYVIAEIGSNHGQDLATAQRLIETAAKSGADAAKFQSLRFDKVHHAPLYGADYRRFFAQIELPEAWYPELARTCRDNGVGFMSSATYLEAIDLLVENGAAAIKIASAQFDIFPEVVAKAAASGLPMVMSTGLSEMEGVDRMMTLVSSMGNRRVGLMHCVTSYPAPLETANVAMLRTYLERYGCVTGYSDHTEGDTALLAAVAHGAKVVEFHITLDKTASGPDHHFASEPNELMSKIAGMRAVESALGTGIKAPLSRSENAQREEFFYKPVTARPIKSGEVLSVDILCFRRAPGGIPHMDRDDYLGKRAARNIEEGVLLERDDLSSK